MDAAPKHDTPVPKHAKRHADFVLRVILIRHGESLNNALMAVSLDDFNTKRVPDAPLTAVGEGQAQKVAAHCAALRLSPPASALYCSAMTRALHTATTIGSALGLRPQLLRDSFEVGGLYALHPDGSTVGHAGLTALELAAQFPTVDDPTAVVAADGWYRGATKESDAEGWKRAVAFVESLRGQAAALTENACAVYVSHGD